MHVTFLSFVHGGINMKEKSYSIGRDVVTCRVVYYFDVLTVCGIYFKLKR